MSQPVIIKSNRYGINLLLDSQMPFDELLKAIAMKFKQSEKFFAGASVGMSLEGRELTSREEQQIVNVITSTIDIDIMCILDNDEKRAEKYRKRIEDRMIYLDGVAKTGEFYRGNLRSGQTLNSKEGVVIVGDVNQGATVISAGNIVILGTLRGRAKAGCKGDKDCFVAAIEMESPEISIGGINGGDILIEKKESGRFLRKKENSSEGFIATVKNGTVSVDPIIKRD